jgi:hypothetical protein
MSSRGCKMKITELFECTMCGMLVPNEETNDNLCYKCFNEWEDYDAWDTYIDEEYENDSSN